MPIQDLIQILKTYLREEGNLDVVIKDSKYLVYFPIEVHLQEDRVGKFLIIE